MAFTLAKVHGVKCLKLLSNGKGAVNSKKGCFDRKRKFS